MVFLCASIRGGAKWAERDSYWGPVRETDLQTLRKHCGPGNEARMASKNSRTDTRRPREREMWPFRVGCVLVGEQTVHDYNRKESEDHLPFCTSGTAISGYRRTFAVLAVSAPDFSVELKSCRVERPHLFIQSDVSGSGPLCWVVVCKYGCEYILQAHRLVDQDIVMIFASYLFDTERRRPRDFES